MWSKIVCFLIRLLVVAFIVTSEQSSRGQDVFENDSTTAITPPVGHVKDDVEGNDEEDPYVRDFLSTVDALKPWFDATIRDLEQLESAPGLAAVKEQALRNINAKIPFSERGHAFAWPFWLHEVKEVNGNSVLVSIRPAVLPPVLDSSRFAVFQYNLESGGVGTKTGVNRFNAPRTVLVDESSTNEIRITRAPEIISRWQPVLDGERQLGVNEETTWFWLAATSGDPLTRDELSRILDGNGGPDRVEIDCRFYSYVADAEEAKKSILPDSPGSGFMLGTKTFVLIDGTGSFKRLLETTRSRVGRSELLRINASPWSFNGELRVEGTSSGRSRDSGRVAGLETYFDMLLQAGNAVDAGDGNPLASDADERAANRLWNSYRLAAERGGGEKTLKFLAEKYPATQAGKRAKALLSEASAHPPGL